MDRCCGDWMLFLVSVHVWDSGVDDQVTVDMQLDFVAGAGS